MNQNQSNDKTGTKVGRNEPCPCGSGRKHKHCCWASETGGSRSPRAGTGVLWKGIIVVVMVGVLIAMVLDLTRGPEPADPTTALIPSSQPAGVSGSTGSPEPWYYDQANNRHWDPTHQHWHDGPPPPGVGSQGSTAGSPGTTPAPWFFDQANNRHWHPTHQHWHDGPPPPPALRQ